VLYCCGLQSLQESR